MPQAIPVIMSAIAYVGGASAAVMAGTATAAQLATVVAVGVGAAGLSMAATKALAPNVGSSGATIDWKPNPNSPIPHAFGRCGTAGTIVHYYVYGQDDRYVSAVSVISGGPIKSFQQFRANQTFVSFDGSGMATSEPYRDEMWLTTRRGLGTDTALASPSGLHNGVTLPRWGSAYTLPGFAATMWTLGENSKRSAYEGRVPVPLNVIEGGYCYDPRFDDTYPGGMGDCRIDDPDTWPYSQNPIIIALAWSIGRWIGVGNGVPYVGYQSGGIGAKLEGIHLPSFVQAANVNDLNGWIAAGVPDSAMAKDQVLDAFLMAGGARYAEFGGKIGCVHRAGSRASIITLTGRDVAGTVEVDGGKDPLDRINTLQPRYWSEAHKWEMVAADEVTSSVWQIEDGQGVAEKRTRGIDYDYVPVSKQSRELATLQVANEREGIAVRCPVRPYIDLEPGHCVVFNEPDFVLNGIKFIVLEVEDSFGSDTLSVILESETDEKYAYAFGQAAAPPPTTELVPYNPNVPAPGPAEWALTSEVFTEGGVSIPALVFTGDVDNATAEAVFFEYRVAEAVTLLDGYRGEDGFSGDFMSQGAGGTPASLAPIDPTRIIVDPLYGPVFVRPAAAYTVSTRKVVETIPTGLLLEVEAEFEVVGLPSGGSVSVNTGLRSLDGAYTALTNGSVAQTLSTLGVHVVKSKWAAAAGTGISAWSGSAVKLRPRAGSTTTTTGTDVRLRRLTLKDIRLGEDVRPWTGAGIEGATVERKEVTGLTNGTQYEGAVSYRVGGRIGDRLVLGPVTAGQLVAGAGPDAYLAKRDTGSISTSGSLALDFPSVSVGGFWEFTLAARDPLSTEVAAGATGNWAVYEQAQTDVGTAGTLIASGGYTTAGFEPTMFEFDGDPTADVAVTGARRVRMILSGASDTGNITATFTAKYNPAG